MVIVKGKVGGIDLASPTDLGTDLDFSSQRRPEIDKVVFFSSIVIHVHKLDVDTGGLSPLFGFELEQSTDILDHPLVVAKKASTVATDMLSV